MQPARFLSADNSQLLREHTVHNVLHSLVIFAKACAALVAIAIVTAYNLCCLGLQVNRR